MVQQIKGTYKLLHDSAKINIIFLHEWTFSNVDLQMLFTVKALKFMRK